MKRHIDRRVSLLKNGDDCYEILQMHKSLLFRSNSLQFCNGDKRKFKM